MIIIECKKNNSQRRVRTPTSRLNGNKLDEVYNARHAVNVVAPAIFLRASTVTVGNVSLDG